MGRKYLLDLSSDAEGDEEAIFEIVMLMLDGLSRSQILARKSQWPDFRIRWLSEAESLIKNELSWPEFHPMARLEKSKADLSREEYEGAVAAFAIPELKKSLGPSFRGWCTDTLRSSYDSGVTVARAVEIAVMDTEFWDGGIVSSTPK